MDPSYSLPRRTRWYQKSKKSIWAFTVLATIVVVYLWFVIIFDGANGSAPLSVVALASGTADLILDDVNNDEAIYGNSSDEEGGPNLFFWVWNSVDPPSCRLFHSVRSVLLHHPRAKLMIYSFIEIAWAAEFPQVQVLPLDVMSVLAETPLEVWYDKRDEWKLDASGFYESHLSEAIRLALLYKFGGVFLETDMLLCKPITTSLRNAFIARGRSDEVGTSFLYFSKGSSLIRAAMLLFSLEYTPRIPTRNAPRILRNICNKLQEEGPGCTVLPSIVMYPIGVENAVHSGGHGLWNQSAVDASEMLKRIRSSSSGVALVTYHGREHHLKHILDTPTDFTGDSVLGRLVAENTIKSSFKCNDGNTSLLQKRTLFGMMKVYSNNIGDEMQALAALQHFPQVDMFISRDSLHEGIPKAPDRLHQQLEVKHRRPKVVVIMNSWFGNHWRAPHDDIYPIFQSWHWHVHRARDVRPKEAFEENLAYLRKREPIGARSLHTRDFLLQHNVSAYFTACLTLSLRNRFLADPSQRTNEIFIVDAPRKPLDPDFLHKFFPKWLLDNATYLSQDIDARHYVNPHLKMFYAMDFLKAYARAKLVITERVHVALPCLAMGTPVLFLVPNNNYGDLRHTGIIELMRVVKGDDRPDLLKDFNFSDPPPNPAQKEIDHYVQRMTRTVREEIFKAAGTVPLPGSNW